MIFHVRIWLRYTLLAALLPLPLCAPGQSVFTEEGQIYALLRDTPGFAKMGVNPSNGALTVQEIVSDIGAPLDAIGYSRMDRLMYGVHTGNKHLYRIDAQGQVEDLGDIGLDPTYDYKAGDISSEGSSYVVIGQRNGADRLLITIDLALPGFPKSQKILPAVTGITDMAFHPTDGTQLFAYDAVNRAVARINYNTADMTGLTILLFEHEIQSLFFTAFGELIALGTANFGVAGALFYVDQQSGVLDILTTGPVYRVWDLAHIPYAIEMQSTPSTRVAFPCNEILYTFPIVNLTGEDHSAVKFEAKLPSGFEFLGMAGNTCGGTVSIQNHTVHIDGMQISKGMEQLKFRVEVGDMPEDVYRIQGQLSGLPDRFGHTVLSDDPLSPQWEDSTRVRVDRLEEDSLFFSRFLCLGDSVVLDATQFGSQIQWYNGSTNPRHTVLTGGEYHLEILGGCQSTVVVYRVTAATCPFTIEVDHTMIPEQTLPCSEVIFKFVIDNDSGTKRDGLKFETVLPEGFTFIAIEENPFGGILDDGVVPQQILIDGLSVPVGKQEMVFRIAVGDIAPGSYFSQATLSGIPAELGPMRLSDDPRTPQHDSTLLEVLGVETDTLYVDEILCEGNTILLDGSLYGVDHHWYNGSLEPFVEVNTPGEYELVVFDGCEPTYIFFIVTAGHQVKVTLDSALYHVRLGDSVSLRPVVFNDGTLLNVWWAEPPDSSLTCTQCSDVLAFPLFDIRYRVYAVNEHCSDSADVRVRVDKTRRIFVPNAFSPNFDGINDFLIIRSPDYGYIESFAVSDRWGSVLYREGDRFINDDGIQWDGMVAGELPATGVYVWSARVRFLDGLTESFAGTVTLIR